MPREGHGCLRQAQRSCTGGGRAPRAFVENRPVENSATHMLRNLNAKTGAVFENRGHFGPCAHFKILETRILPTMAVGRSNTV